VWKSYNMEQCGIPSFYESVEIPFVIIARKPRTDIVYRVKKPPVWEA